MNKFKKIECEIGIMAYNEEKNIGRLLSALLSEKHRRIKISNIFVIASGCTDNTVQIIQKFREKKKNIKLLLQKRREGKASAINFFVKNAEKDILILESGDTVPEKGTISKLIEPFSNSEIGMTGAHIIPIDNPKNFWGFATSLQWNLHHMISLKKPKMGELVAFRKIFAQIPKFSSVDEANIEPLIKGQGLKLKYIPGAIVYNKGPENLSDFLKQRRRIFAGHLTLKKEQGYTVSTMNGIGIFFLFLKNFKMDFRYIFWAPLIIILEIYARLLGFIDFYFKKKNYMIWERSETTKELIK